MAQYWVKVMRVFEDYIEADSEDEAIRIAQDAMLDGDLGYWDNEVERCDDEEEEDED